MSIRVFLVDDHTIILDGLRTILEGEVDIVIIGEATNGRDALQRVRELQPDVVVMDIAMPDLNGMDATRQILSHAPQTRIIALTMHTGCRFVSGMLNAGATGYLVKNCRAHELVEAIRTVADHRVYLGAGIADMVVAEFKQNFNLSNIAPDSTLTSREYKILQRIVDGHATREIADTLEISVKTVERHRQQIMEKLRVNTVAGLTRYAVKEGMMSLHPDLSEREREVLQLLAEGKSPLQIAEILYISMNTVNTHKKHIMQKLQIHSLVELTKFAMREGLTTSQ